MVKEGYIPYLKKWSNPQQSAEVDSDKKKKLQEEDLHSDKQRLWPRRSEEVDLKELTNSDDTRHLHRSQISDSQTTNLQRDEERFINLLNCAYPTLDLGDGTFSDNCQRLLANMVDY